MTVSPDSSTVPQLVTVRSAPRVPVRWREDRRRGAGHGRRPHAAARPDGAGCTRGDSRRRQSRRRDDQLMEGLQCARCRQRGGRQLGLRRRAGRMTRGARSPTSSGQRASARAGCGRGPAPGRRRPPIEEPAHRAHGARGSPIERMRGTAPPEWRRRGPGHRQWRHAQQLVDDRPEPGDGSGAGRHDAGEAGADVAGRKRWDQVAAWVASWSASLTAWSRPCWSWARADRRPCRGAAPFDSVGAWSTRWPAVRRSGWTTSTTGTPVRRTRS